MPKLSDDEIKNNINSGNIFAISVDTSIFDKYKCTLDFPPLSKLDQFQAGNLRVLLSTIVVDEVKSHIKRDALESQNALRKAMKGQSQRWRIGKIDTKIEDYLKLSDNAADEAAKQVDEFIKAVAAIDVPLNQTPDIADEVFRRYFASDLPFEPIEKKKHEFPDAFALLSLEHHANTQSKMILCVSQDKGWHKFAESSPHLVVIDDLERTLSLFHEAGLPIAQKAATMLREGIIATDVIESVIQSRLDDCDFEVDARSILDFEIEEQCGSLQSIDLSSIINPIVIDNNINEIIFTVDINSQILFSATFTFYVRDSIDRDYISIGCINEEIINDIPIEITITLSKYDNRIINAQASRKSIHARFGEIEPFMDEDPTFEKY